MGMSVVPAWAAWREVVPLAMIRSTPEETNPLMMVAALEDSPEAFCGSNSTVPPAAVRLLLSMVSPALKFFSITVPEMGAVMV